MVIFFLAPALTSGYFYLRVIRTLLAQERRVERNRILSIAFSLSWLLWVVTWIPNYAFGFLELTKLDFSEIYGGRKDTFLGYFFSLKSSIQMLYPHLNVFIYLMVLPRFRQYHVDLLKKIKNIIFGEINARKSRKVCLAMTAVVFTVCCLFSVIFFSILSSNTLVHTVRSFKLVQEPVLTNRKSFASLRISHNDVTIKKDASSFRDVCANQHGRIDYRYRRCFFTLEFENPGLNFSEQVTQCRTHGGILSYPRSLEESEFIWKIRRENQNLHPQFKEFIHVGFQVSVKDILHPEFLSLDGKLAISSATHEHMFYKHRGFFFVFKGPSICLTDSALLTECLPRDPTTRCVCSADFEQLHALKV